MLRDDVPVPHTRCDLLSGNLNILIVKILGSDSLGSLGWTVLVLALGVYIAVDGLIATSVNKTDRYDQEHDGRRRLHDLACIRF